MDDAVRGSLRVISERYLTGTAGCHQMDHTLRVVDNALRLVGHYPEADADVVEAAAWLHDIGRGMEREVDVSHATLSAQLAEKLLPAEGFSPPRVRIATEAIADHRFSAGYMPASLEGKLLQDADRLDALGAIGIARTFSFAENRQRELYHASDPFAAERALDDKRYALDHFFRKLLKLPEVMHTLQARALAEERARFMCVYLRELASEIGMTIPTQLIA